MQFFYDLSSLGNFYSFSVDIIVYSFWLVHALFACILYALIIIFILFYFHF